jgi:N-acetylglucosaminyl-diphospho-decaprenol L-rhamnosyltransferase
VGCAVWVGSIFSVSLDRHLYNAAVLVLHFPGEAAIPDPAQAADLALVVINFDSGDHLRNCITHLCAAAAGIPVQVVVVDNASTDGSRDGVEAIDPRVTVLDNTLNVGYGRACNQGFKATNAPFVWFLNPDIVPDSDSLAKMLAAISARPDAGVMGPRLLNPDGTTYPSCRVVPKIGVAVGHAIFGLISDKNRFTRAYKLMDISHDSEQEVDWVSGAAMLIRREAFEQVGGFDEGFFMYVEDLDLCSRIKDAGWKNVYYPGAQMLHYVAGSSRRHPYKMIRHHHFSLIRFAARRLKGPLKIFVPAVAAGLIVRMLLVWGELFFRKGSRRANSSTA